MKIKTTATVAAFFIAAAFMLVSGSPLQASEGAADKVEHTVLKGDNLSLLAGYYYKDPRQWRRIYEANRDQLRDPQLIVPGAVLTITMPQSDSWEISYRDFIARVNE